MFLESQLFKVSVGGLDDVAVLQNFKESAARSRALQGQIKSIKKKLYEVESNFRTNAWTTFLVSIFSIYRFIFCKKTNFLKNFRSSKMTKKSNESRQRKYGLIDKIAPQESDGEDDRKPFPGQEFG